MKKNKFYTDNRFKNDRASLICYDLGANASFTRLTSEQWKDNVEFCSCFGYNNNIKDTCYLHLEKLSSLPDRFD